MKKLFLLLFFICSYSAVISQWQRMPGPGEYKSITSVSTNNNEILISIRNNIFSSTDLGESWKDLNSNSDFIFNEIWDVKKVKGKIFVATSSTVKDPTRGIFMSTDNGLSWRAMNVGINMNNAGMVNKFYVQDNDIYAIYTTKIYKYDFNNNKWELPYDTTVSRPLFNTNSMIINNDKMFIGSTVYKQSIDNGARNPNICIYSLKTKEWVLVFDSVSGIWRETIYSFVEKNNKLFAATSGGLFVSTDEGLNWTRKRKGLHVIDSNYTPPYEYDYAVNDLKVHNNFIYAFLTGLSPTVGYSTDDGENWQVPKYKKYTGITQGMELFEDKLLISSDFGLFYSTDSLTNSTSILDTNLYGSNCNIVSDNGKLYAVAPFTSNWGVWVSNDNGLTWEKRGNDLINMDMTKIGVKDNFIIVGDGYYNKSPYYSTDGGATFQKINNDSNFTHQQVFCIEINNDIVYLGTKFGIYYSADWGKTWNELHKDLSNFIIFNIKFKDNYIFACSQKNNVFISSDNGISWKISKIPYNNKHADYSLDIMDIHYFKKRIFAGARGYYKDGGYAVMDGGGVFISNNYGETWTEKNEGLTNIYGVGSITSYDSHLFIGMSNLEGVYYTPNLNDNWRSYNFGLTNAYIEKLLIQGKYLFAATLGGVYRVPLSDFGLSDLEDNFTSQNNEIIFPNPASDYITLNIPPLEKRGLGGILPPIEIYNIFGECVSTTPALRATPPSKGGEFRIDVAALPAGVYFVRIGNEKPMKFIKL